MSGTPTLQTASANSRFLAFFDECGDHSLVKVDPDFPLFVLATVIVERGAYRDVILPAFNALKLRYWDHEGINFHSREIRVSSGPFLLLRNPAVRPGFMSDLSRVVEQAPFTLFIAAVRKQEYLQLHGNNAANPYDLALEFSLERLAAFLAENREATLPIVAEARGKVEDGALSAVFSRTLVSGTASTPATTFNGLSLTLSFQPKQKNIIGNQLADLCAYPCARHILHATGGNRPFEVVRRKLYHGEEGSGWKVYP